MATYPTHGLRLRQRHPNRWLLVAIAVVAALAGAGAWALVNHYTGRTTGATTGSATLMSRGVANEYIAALDKLHPSALQPIVAKNAVSIDAAYGSSPFHSAKTLIDNWAGVFEITGDTHWRGSLCCAGPNWAAVTWRWRGTTNPLTNKPFKMHGLSILNIKNGKIARETYFWVVPGRNPGIAPSIGSKYATTLAAHQPGWGQTLRSLYSKNAVEVDMAAATHGRANNLIWARWGPPALVPLHASVCCTAPSFGLDNGKMTKPWAVVDWVAKLHFSGDKAVSGVSILQLNKQGKIIRETLYY